jgi:hypothetical protein
MKLVLTTCVFALAALAQASCHSSSSGSGGGATASTATSAGFVTDFCSLLAPCCPDASAQVCQAFASAPFLQTAPQPVTYDPTLGQACIAAMQQESSGGNLCTTLGADVPQCVQVFSTTGGTAQPGQSCVLDSDCAAAAGGGGAVCFGQVTLDDGGSGAGVDGGSVATEVRTCVQTTPGKVGDGPCIGTQNGASTTLDWGGDGGPPAQAVVCDAAGGATCDELSGKCVALAATGAPCSTDSTCAPGAYCAVLDGGSQCAPRLADGTSCANAFTGCLPTSYCDTSSTSCTPLLAAGSSCTFDDQCASSACVSQVCGATGSLALASICGSP